MFVCEIGNMKVKSTCAPLFLRPCSSSQLTQTVGDACARARPRRSPELIFPDVFRCWCVKEAATVIAALQAVAEVVDGSVASCCLLVCQSSTLLERSVLKKWQSVSQQTCYDEEEELVAYMKNAKNLSKEELRCELPLDFGQCRISDGVADVRCNAFES